MNTSKTDVEILPIEPVELERTPARAGETLIHRFRTFFLGVLLSGCAAAPGNEKPVEPVKTPEIVPEKKSASSTEPHRWDAIIGVDLAGEEQKPSEKPVFMTMAFHEISPLNASLLTPSFEPASVGTGNAVMASFPKAEIDQAPLPEPLPIDLPPAKTPDVPAYFSIAPGRRHEAQEIPSIPVALEPQRIPLRTPENIPEIPSAVFEHPRELMYLYLLFGVLAATAAGLIGHERLQARKIQAILAELEHGRL